MVLSPHAPRTIGVSAGERNPPIARCGAEWRSLRLRRLFAEREFDELLAAYIMNDADLWRTVSQQSKRHEGISWGGVGCLDHSVSAAKASLLAEPTTPSLRRVSRRD